MANDNIYENNKTNLSIMILKSIIADSDIFEYVSKYWYFFVFEWKIKNLDDQGLCT